MTTYRGIVAAAVLMWCGACSNGNEGNADAQTQDGATGIDGGESPNDAGPRPTDCPCSPGCPLPPPPPESAPVGPEEAMVPTTLLGTGTDHTGTRKFARCLVFTEAELEIQNKSGDYSGTVDFVSSNRELRDKLGIGAGVSARGIWGDFSSAFTYGTEKSVDSSKLYFAANAKIRSQTAILLVQAGRVTLSADARALLENYGRDAFHETCGTHFWISEDRGARYTLLFQHNRAELATREELTVIADGHYNGGTDEFGASFNLATLNQMTMKDVDYHVDVLAEGVPLNMINLSIEDLISDPQSFFDGNLSTIARYLGDHPEAGKVLTHEPQGYEMVPDFQRIVQSMQNSGPSKFFSDSAVRDRSLERYLEEYMANEEEISRLEQLLTGARRTSPPPLYRFVADNTLTLVDDRIASLRDVNHQIDSLAIACLATDGRSLPCGMTIADACPEPPSAGAPLVVEYEDLSQLEGWSLRKRFIPGWQNGALVEIYGRSAANPNQCVRFQHANNVWADLTSQQFFYLTRAEADFTADEKVALSPQRAFEDLVYPDGTRPNVCLGASHSNACNLRVAVDSQQLTSLELTLFDLPGAARGRTEQFIASPSTECPSDCEGTPTIGASFPGTQSFGTGAVLPGRTVTITKSCDAPASGLAITYRDSAALDNNETSCNWSWQIAIDGRHCDSPSLSYDFYNYTGPAHTAPMQNIEISGICTSAGGMPLNGGLHTITVELGISGSSGGDGNVACFATMLAGGFLSVQEQ